MKFNIGPEAFYARGVYVKPYSVLEDLPPDIEPSRKWEPLDEEAEEAIAKLKAKDAAKLAERAVQPTVNPKELAELVAKLVANGIEAELAKRDAQTKEKKPAAPSSTTPPTKSATTEPTKEQGKSGRASDKSVI